MASFAIRQTMKTAGGALVLAAFATPSTGFSQRSHGAAERQQMRVAAERESQILESNQQEQSQNSSLPEIVDLASDEWRQIVESLQEEAQAAELQNGRDSTDWIDPLTALGLLYQEDGDYPLAAAAFERARQIVRINYGLYSIEEVRLLRLLIRNAEAMGDVETAWHLEQELLTLAERHPDDLQTVPVLREIGDKRIDVLERYIAGGFPEQIVLGCYYEPPEDTFAARAQGARTCRSGSRRRVIGRLLREAQSYYQDAIGVILGHELYSSDELRELEMKLVRSSYWHGTYWVGRQSLRRLLAYDVANSEPSLTRVDALVQMADWEVLFAGDIGNFSRRESALEVYAQAYQLLEEEGVEQASIDEIFSPRVPVTLPTFLPNPLVSEDATESAEYIDVAFDITKHGKSEHVEILDTTTDMTRAAERELVRLIERRSFRPRVTNGEFADAASVVVRYYLDD